MFERRVDRRSAQACKMPIDLVSRAPHWHCSNCDAGFRIFNGKEPLCCPLCGIGKSREEAKLLPEPNVRAYRCPKCGENLDILGNKKPKFCPACGEEIQV